MDINTALKIIIPSFTFVETNGFFLRNTPFIFLIGVELCTAWWTEEKPKRIPNSILLLGFEPNQVVCMVGKRANH